MKYTKPATRNSVVLLNFLDSLPAEFEIVEPGMTQVRWPEGLPKETLTRLADNISQQLNAWEFWPAQSAALYALAAIAPVEKKKRKVWLWEKDHPHYTERSWTSNDIDRSGGGWRKVGECEVDA